MPDAASPFPRPLTGPPPWVPLVAPADGEAGAGEEPAPGEHWPRYETVDYISKLLMLIILLLALPWLFQRLLTHPGDVSRQAAGMAPVGA
ncbi:MAG TPA: hypothetical protein VFG58_02855 [Solirubrobacterales bacterium]|nr:hypothetical protein [Solirubrobacterales bacterium]